MGKDGNTRRMKETEINDNYDFNFKDERDLYTDAAHVYENAEGEVVEVVDHLDDIYDSIFYMDEAIREDRI